MQLENPMIEGRLVRRYKRFLADVELDDGSIITAHCPNTGSLLGCKEPGSRVVLRDSQNPKRKYVYVFQTIEVAGTLVNVDTGLPNAAVFEAIEQDKIPELVGSLEGYDQVVGARTSEQGTAKFFRVPAKWFIRGLAGYLVQRPIPDLNSGFRAFRRDVADQFLVIAWTDQEKKKKRDHSGMSAFIVERGFAGFSSYTLKEKWGILAGNTGGFVLQDVEVPAENRVGEEGEGFKVAMFALENGRYTVAAGATGLIRAFRDASVRYAQGRQTFRVPIGEHQLVKEMIAQMVSDYEASRLLWLKAGWMKNTGRRNTRETSLAKWFATVGSERAAGDAVQIHGANGYSDEYPVGRYYRNCKAAVIYEGSREVHKLMQADYALGYRRDKPRRVELPGYRP